MLRNIRWERWGDIANPGNGCVLIDPETHTHTPGDMVYSLYNQHKYIYNMYIDIICIYIYIMYSLYIYIHIFDASWGMQHLCRGRPSCYPDAMSITR